MAITFNTGKQGFVNTWTQLRNIVRGKSLYNDSDYEALSANQKEQYLLMLYDNNAALEQRLPAEYNSEYADAQIRYALLANEYAAHKDELARQSPEYTIERNKAVMQQFNSEMQANAGKNKSWVDWIVENRYSGDYSMFMTDYSEGGKTYEDALTEMVPAEYGLDEKSFESGIKDTKDAFETTGKKYDNAASEAYKNTLEYAKDMIKRNASMQAYKDASTFRKVINTIWQSNVLLSAEVGEIVEGVVDALAGTAEIVAKAFGKGEKIEEFIENDWWQPEVWLTTAVPASYLNQYTDNNFAKVLHGVGISIVDMSTLAIPYAGTAVYYTSMAGRTLEDELQAGYTFGKAVTYTLGSTAIEFATEKISGTKLLGGGISKSWEKIGMKNLGLKILHDAVGEGMEEVVAGIGSDIWHGIVTGDMTLNTGEGWANIAQAALSGALVGGIMAGGDAAISSIITRGAAAKVTNANGASIVLPARKVGVIQQFIQTVGAKIESGKNVSDKTRERFDKLKNLRIVDAEFNNKTVKLFERWKKTGKEPNADDFGYKAFELQETADYYKNEVMPGIIARIAEDKASKGDKEKKTPTKREDVAKALSDIDTGLKNKPGDSKTTFEFTEKTGLDKKDAAAYVVSEFSKEEDRAKAIEDFNSTFAMALAKMVRMFGSDVVTEGLRLFAEYQNKTIDEVLRLLDNPQIRKSDSSTKELETAFPSAQFSRVEPASDSDLYDMLDGLISMTEAFKKTLKHFSRLSVKLFVTSTATVSTSFIIGDTVYVNAEWLIERGLDAAKDVIITKLIAEESRRILDDNSENSTVRTLLLESVAKVANPTRSTEMMVQELTYVMLFQKDSILRQQILALAEDESGALQLAKYLDDIRNNVPNISARHAAALIGSNMVTTYEDSQDTGEDPDYSKIVPAVGAESLRSLVLGYNKQSFRAFPFITGENGLPVPYAKLNAMYLHFKKKYGLNIELDLTTKIDWLTVLLEPKNYDGDGYTKLLAELKLYSDYDNKYEKRSNKSNAELLNYYIDQNCGLMVYRKGIISETVFTTEILNMKKLDDLVMQYKDHKAAGRERIGTVGDYLTERGNNMLPDRIKEMPIYMTFDSSTNNGATIAGDMNSGMIVVINFANISNELNRVLVGGKQLVMNEDGELVKLDDYTFETRNYTYSCMQASRKIGHEIGHSIGMFLGFNGTFDETGITKAYGEILSGNAKTDKFNYSVEDFRREFVTSLKNWLMPKGAVDESKLLLGHFIDERISLKTEKGKQKAIDKIKDFCTKLDRLPKESSKIQKLLSPLATYLYFTHYAHEMFASGEAASVARTDLIHSRSVLDEPYMDFPRSGSTVLLTETDLPFLNVLNGYTLRQNINADSVNYYLTALQDSPENATRAVFTGIRTTDELMKELGVEFAAELVSPDFWRKKLPENTEKKPASRSALIDGIERRFDCTYDNYTQEFKPGYISKSLRDPFGDVPNVTEGFAMVLFKNGTRRDLADGFAYSEASDVAASVLHRPAIHGQAERFIVHVDTGDVRYNKNTGELLINGTRMSAPVRPTYVSGGKIFGTAAAVRKYFSTELQHSTVQGGEDFELLFEEMTSDSKIDKQLQYTDDVLYMTTDGQIYGIDSETADPAKWYDIAGDLYISPTYTVGNVDTDNLPEEGIPWKMVEHFNSKGLLRLYRKGNGWVAYGTPNAVQDRFIDELRAERKSEMPYSRPNAKRGIFFKKNEKGDRKFIIAQTGFSGEGYKEVYWNESKWYDTICKIATAYGLTSFEDFKFLGFTEEFVSRLKETNGLRDQDVLAYIRESSNTDFSRNILISYCPDDKGIDWKHNANIKSIEEARKYWELALHYAQFLPEGDTKVYRDEAELQLAMSKLKKQTDIGDPGMAIQSETILRVLGGDIFIQLLNQDHKDNLVLNGDKFRKAFYNLFIYANHRDKGESDIEDRQYGEEDTDLNKVNERYSKDPEYTAFLNEVKRLSANTDEKSRQEDLEETLKVLDEPRYAGKDWVPEARNRVMNAIEKTNLTRLQRAKLKSTKERVEAYKQLKEGSPEQLQERRYFNREYEHLRKRVEKAKDSNERAYYSNMQKLIGGVGSYTSDMAAKFSYWYKRATENRERVANKEAYDKSLNNIKALRDNLLKVDMEYPGWYEMYDQLLETTKAWVNGQIKTRADAQAMITPIVNYINAFEKDAEFKDMIAKRENVSDYALSGQIRGYQLSEADLEKYDDIPKDFKDISKLPFAAREFYNAFKNSGNPEALRQVLSNTEYMTMLLKTPGYGQDLIYNLKKLYNDMISQNKGTAGVSQAKTLGNLGNILANALGEESAKKFVENTKKSTVQSAMNTAIRTIDEGNYITYREYATNNALRKDWYTWLERGEPVQDSTRLAALEEQADLVKNYRWKIKAKRRVFTIHIPAITMKHSSTLGADYDNYEAAKAEFEKARSIVNNANSNLRALTGEDWLDRLRALLPRDSALRDQITEYFGSKAFADKLLNDTNAHNPEIDRLETEIRNLESEETKLRQQLKSYAGPDKLAEDLTKQARELREWFDRLWTEYHEADPDLDPALIQQKLERAYPGKARQLEVLNKRIAERLEEIGPGIDIGAIHQRLSVIADSKKNLEAQRNDYIEKRNAMKAHYDTAMTKVVTLYRGLSDAAKTERDKFIAKYKNDYDTTEPTLSGLETRMNSLKGDYDIAVKGRDALNIRYRDRVAEGLLSALKKYNPELTNATVYDREKENFNLAIETGNVLTEKDELPVHPTTITFDIGPGAKTVRADVIKILQRHLGDNYKTAVKEEELSLDRDKSLYSLPRAKKYKVTTALMWAYYNFIDNPPTDRSIEKFKVDVRMALEDGSINLTLPQRGGKGKKAISVSVPEEYKIPVEQGGTEFGEEQVNARLKRFLKHDLPSTADSVVKARSELEQFRLDAISERVDLEASVRDELETSGMKLRQALNTIYKRRTKYRVGQNIDYYRPMTDTERSEYEFVLDMSGVRERSKYLTDARMPRIVFDKNTGEFIDTGVDGKGREVIPAENVDLNAVQPSDADAYIDYQIENGFAQGLFGMDAHGNVIDAETGDIIINKNRLIATRARTLTPTSTGARVDRKAREDVDISVLEEFNGGTIPDESDFETDDETPSEDDFTGGAPGVSKHLDIEDFDIYPADVEEGEKAEKVRPAKGSWTDSDNGMSVNTNHILNYVPKNWDTKHEFDTVDFIKDNHYGINQFNANMEDIAEFIEMVESNPSIPLNSPQEATIFALLNQVVNNPLVPADLMTRARKLRTDLKARAGRTLGQAKGTGVTPIDELVGICSRYLKLSDAEKQALANGTAAQKTAIAQGDYKRANEIYELIIALIKTHADELPVSMNVFAGGLSPEERTTRWRNLTNKITSWRYFAMLGAPTTFFVKNMTSNAIMTALNKAAEGIGAVISKLAKRETLKNSYSFADDTVAKLYNGDTITAEDVNDMIALTVTDASDRKKIDNAELTKYLTKFVNTRKKTDGKAPSAVAVAAKANEWLRNKFYQYRLDGTVTEEVDALVQKELVDSGLVDGLMSDTTAKYDRGFDVKVSKVNLITLDKNTDFENLSEQDASILADAIRQDQPFKWRWLNGWYRFIFKTMEAGDKLFIKPKIIKIVKQLVASNMTSEEMQLLAAGGEGSQAARAKFNDFVMYAMEDAAQTYFRGNSEFQQKIMRMFKNHPIIQLIFGTIMPFPRMALNVMRTALDYSPIGFVKAILIKRNGQDAFTNIKFDKAIGKAATGSILMGVGALLAAIGVLDFDDEDEYAGIQLLVGNRVRFALSDLSPTSLPFIVGASMVSSKTNGFWNAMYNGGNALLDGTLLGEAIEVFGGNKESVDVVTDTFESFINQFMPAVIRHAARVIDPTKKKYSNNPWAKIMQRVGAAIPWASRLVPNKIDPYTGDPIYQNASASFGWARVLSFVNAFSPMKVTADIRSDVEIESEAVGANTTGPAKEYTIDGVKYMIPDKVYKEYQVLRAKLYSKYTQAIINTQNYKRLSIEKKKAKLRQLQNKATVEARKQLNIGN